jgi:hypothetical protein
MSSDDGEDSRDEEQELVLMKDLFEQEHHDPKGKYEYGALCMVMPFESVCQ